MFRWRAALLVALCGALAIAGLMVVRLVVPDAFPRPLAALAASSAPPSGRIRFAVLGDSDSQSYHDSLLLGDPSLRGGARRATTWQWTEVLARLRGNQIDLGKWNAWGTNRYRAWFNEAIGINARTPPKDDYRYDFAVTGATCNQLMGRSQRQAIRLVHLMDADPYAWRGGIVLIRIGVNDFGHYEVLDQLARDPHAAHPTALINACVAAIGNAVALVRRHHPDTYVALVGILTDADTSEGFERWKSARAMANIESGLDRFDDGLRKLAATDRHICFFDDRAWFRNLWGARDARGRPLYRTVHLSAGWAITDSSGDDPHNAVVADGHAGVVWNTLWAQSLVTSLNTAFGLHLAPITDTEVVTFLQRSFS